MELSLATRTVADHTVLEVGGEVDVYTAPRLRERLVELVDGGATQRRGRPGAGSTSSTPPASACWSAASSGCAPPDGTLRPGLRQGAAAQDLPDHRPRPGVPDLPLGRGGDSTDGRDGSGPAA